MNQSDDFLATMIQAVCGCSEEEAVQSVQNAYTHTIESISE